MKKEYNKEHIIYIIEAVENLGIDGFHWEELDEKFLECQNELKNSVDEIIYCLESIERSLSHNTYYAEYDCYASEVKEMVENDQHPVISLGSIIAALLYLRGRIQYEIIPLKSDLKFRLPEAERMDRVRSRKICYEMGL